VHKTEDLVKSSQELVLFVGCPASGKSTFARKHFVPNGYVHVNQDTLKTKEKCIKAARIAVEEGKSVVVDNTNPGTMIILPFQLEIEPGVRANYTEIAKEKGIPCRCFVFNTDVKLAHHLNFYREVICGKCFLFSENYSGRCS
jgi:bifunctional polynucleotide phosphatase/kinase